MMHGKGTRLNAISSACGLLSVAAVLGTGVVLWSTTVPRGPGEGQGVYPEENCPTGDCDPGGSGNGRGLYTAEVGQDCLEYNASGHFCPEALVNTPEGVVLEGRALERPGELQGRAIEAMLDEQPVKLARVSGEGSRLSLVYKAADGAYQTLQGADLSRLKLRFSFEAGQGSSLPVEMRLQDQGEAEMPGLQQYQLLSGAIASCMLWGYTPWNSPSEQPQRVREDLFASCLHAKRAAYFVGQGDFTSYTRNGTRILLQDAYGIQGKGIRLENLEAVWGPQGAVCLNLENQRRPEFDLSAHPEVKPCTRAQLSQGLLATGRLSMHATSH